MAKTTLLPTSVALRIAWALTGKFSNDDSSRTMSTYAEDELKGIEEKSRLQEINPAEKSYIAGAIAAIRAGSRSLETIYKGRELNFEETQKMQDVYIKSIQEKLDFGNKVQDFFKSLPAMAIGGAGGITLLQAFAVSSKVSVWAIGLLSAAAGYMINLWIVQWARRRTQMLYVIQDYERDLYYDQYISRVHDALAGLFLDLERLHRRAFQENCEADTQPGTVENIINGVLSGVRSTFCPYAHKHMREGKITPDVWAMCESGHAEASRRCPMWEGKRLPLPVD